MTRSTRQEVDPDGDRAELPRQSLLALIPRRSLWKIAALLFLLAGVIYFQRRADRVAREMTKVINLQNPTAASSSGATSPASGATSSTTSRPAGAPALNPATPRQP